MGAVWRALLGCLVLWMCVAPLMSIGCSNNNYASRDKCKKCGQPKEVAAMPAIAMPGASLPTYAHYFARALGVPGLKVMTPNNPNWPFGGADKYGLPATPAWPFHGNSGGAFPFGNNANQLYVVPKGWRSGDWICNCGFHNYSSRAQCKKCNASMPSGEPSSVENLAVSALGTKRLASDEFVNDWDNKRLNAGDMTSHFMGNGRQHSYQGFQPMTGQFTEHTPDMYATYPSANPGPGSNFQMHIHSPQLATMPTLIGKGAKQWRDGDWMCKSCNNHNFASRTHCNRCKTQKEVVNLPVTVA